MLRVLRVSFAFTAEVSKMQPGCRDGKVKSIFAKHDLLTYTLLLPCQAVLLSRGPWSTEILCVLYNLVRIHQMESNEGYGGGQKRDRIYYVNKRTDARDPRYIIMWSTDYRFGT